MNTLTMTRWRFLIAAPDGTVEYVGPKGEVLAPQSEPDFTGTAEAAAEDLSRRSMLWSAHTHPTPTAMTHPTYPLQREQSEAILAAGRDRESILRIREEFDALRDARFPDWRAGQDCTSILQSSAA